MSIQRFQGNLKGMILRAGPQNRQVGIIGQNRQAVYSCMLSEIQYCTQGAAEQVIEGMPEDMAGSITPPKSLDTAALWGCGGDPMQTMIGSGMLVECTAVLTGSSAHQSSLSAFPIDDQISSGRVEVTVRVL